MRVIAYLRVSTDRQAEEGLGIEVQEETIRTWAAAAGHDIAAIARDEGISGSNGLDTRVALAEALNALGNGEAEGLVVYRLDRLARDLVLQEQLLAEVHRMGANVFSCSEAEGHYLRDDPGDPSRRLIRQVLGAVSEYERAMITLRLQAGRRRKADNGGFAYGSPPYGYRAKNGELVEEPIEQRGIVRIRELHQGKASTRVIAQTLQLEGFRPPRGNAWHSATVARILRRPALLLTPGSHPYHASRRG